VPIVTCTAVYEVTSALVSFGHSTNHYAHIERNPLNTRWTENKQDRQCAYKRNTEARSRKRSCHGQAVNVTYSECVLEDLRVVTQHAKRIRHIDICDPFGCTIFFHIIS
jgi:hypothetical protein